MAAWESLVKILFSEEIDANLLDLVHLSNSFRVLPREKGAPNQVDCVVIRYVSFWTDSMILTRCATLSGAVFA
jgi:hypothetical protein